MGEQAALHRAYLWFASLAPIFDIAAITLALFSGVRLVFRRHAKAVLWLCNGAILLYGIAGILSLVAFRIIFPVLGAVVVFACTIAAINEAGRFLDWLKLLDRNGTRGSLGVGRNGPWVDAIVDGFISFASRRLGALLVVKGRDHIENHLTGGIPLGGKISRELLMSLFDPHSPGHDGAVIVQGGRFSRFGVQLPLSRNISRPEKFGTRHAAALGLAERTDALILVASEETGKLRIAEDGRLLDIVDGAELKLRLQSFLRRTHHQGDEGRLRSRRPLYTHWQEAVAALSIAVACHYFAKAGLL
ncbi:MAG: diadenylate cyclase [Myxococcota bacterium]